MPKQRLSTFGTTNIKYFMLSRSGEATRVREGRVISQRPQIIRPAEISELFEGFGENSSRFGEAVFDSVGQNPRVLNYRFRNTPRSSTRTSDPVSEVFGRLNEEAGRDGASLTAILEGLDSAWQVSVMKMIIDLTLLSAGENISEMEERGMFPDEKGVPDNIRNRVEFLFREAENNPSGVEKLGKFLNDKEIFRDYEDRFFRLLKKRRKL